MAVSDIGVVGDDKDGKDGKEHNDSFEKYYNKDLDLDEGKYYTACQFFDLAFTREFKLD